MALCRIGRTTPRVGRAATPPGPCAATPFSGFHAHETIRSRRSGPTTSTSAQFCQTCAVSSQSIRQPSTYFPGRKLDGTTTRSATMPSVQSPEQYPQWSSLPPVAQPPSPGCASQSNQPRSTSGHGEGNCWQSPASNHASLVQSCATSGRGERGAELPLAALHGPRRGGPSVHSPSRAKPRLSVLMRGTCRQPYAMVITSRHRPVRGSACSTGLRAHVEPSGRTYSGVPPPDPGRLLLRGAEATPPATAPRSH